MAPPDGFSGNPCDALLFCYGPVVSNLLSGVDRCNLRVAQGFHIAFGRLPEEAPVLAAELADALVTDLVCRTRGIEPIRQHAPPRFLQPELLLILERAHPRQCAELVVQRRDTHAGYAREFV